jgi:aspartyl-tRNA(Asn)/glutamyl-tRNA(Gln) amidotransferase subunit A
MIRQEYEKIFQTVDAIITPTAPNPAFPLGAKTSDPLQMYLEDIFTVPVNIAGVPAISVPMGKTEGGLPLGLQITAPHWREDVLFSIGKKFEA